MYPLILSAATLLGLTACGSSSPNTGGGGSNIADVQGIWQGVAGTDNSRVYSGVILNNGDYWFRYTGQGRLTGASGLVKGNLSANSGKVSSQNGSDYNFESYGFNNFNMNGNFVPKSSFSGLLVYTSGSASVGFGSNIYSNTSGNSPSLSTIVGTYSGYGSSVAQNQATSLVIDNNGKITGTSSALFNKCDFTGSVSPSSIGNAYNTTISFSGAGCPATGIFSGVGHYIESTRELNLPVIGGNQKGFVYSGKKQ